MLLMVVDKGHFAYDHTYVCLYSSYGVDHPIRDEVTTYVVNTSRQVGNQG